MQKESDIQCQACEETGFLINGICTNCHWQQINLQQLGKHERLAYEAKFRELRNRLMENSGYDQDDPPYVITETEQNVMEGIGEIHI